MSPQGYIHDKNMLKVHANARQLVAPLKLRPLRSIGEGYKGVVWLCETADKGSDARGSKYRVVKLGLEVSVIQNEVSIMLRPDHPGILKLQNCHKGSKALVLPYIPGRTLKDFQNQLNSERQRTVPTAFVYHVFVSLLDIIHALHTRRDSNGLLESVAHKDIWIGNIMISCTELENGFPKIWLIDFGNAEVGDLTADLRRRKALQFDMEALGHVLHCLAHSVGWFCKGRQADGTCAKFSMPKDGNPGSHPDHCQMPTSGFERIDPEFRTEKFDQLLRDLSQHGVQEPGNDAAGISERYMAWAVERRGACRCDECSEALSMGFENEI